jgi:hypothetical protein
MFQAKDGKKFGSAFAGKRYDEAHSTDGMHTLGESEEKESPKMEDEEKKMGEEKENEGEEHPVVAEHGKAHKVIIHHDEKAGKHHVTSYHKDGHENHSEHENAVEAHAEGKKLSGVAADGEEKDHQSPYDQHGKPQAGASSEEDGFAMPDLV